MVEKYICPHKVTDVYPLCTHFNYYVIQVGYSPGMPDESHSEYEVDAGMVV
jgi:hypothetical protein